MKIATYLPIFNGFYGTWFECSDDTIESEIDYHREETGNDGLIYDDLEFDFDDYRQRVAEACVGAIWNELKLLFEVDANDFDIEFEELVSPKYYNYSNDSINVVFKLNKNVFSKILSYLYNNIEEFKGYIEERYSDRSGFISYYSNDAVDWLTSLHSYFDHYSRDNNTDAGKFGLDHLFGAVMEFVLLNEDYTDSNLYDAVCDETCYIKSNVNNNYSTP